MLNPPISPSSSDLSITVALMDSPKPQLPSRSLDARNITQIARPEEFPQSAGPGLVHDRGAVPPAQGSSRARPSSKDKTLNLLHNAILLSSVFSFNNGEIWSIPIGPRLLPPRMDPSPPPPQRVDPLPLGKAEFSEMDWSICEHGTQVIKGVITSWRSGMTSCGAINTLLVPLRRLAKRKEGTIDHEHHSHNEQGTTISFTQGSWRKGIKGVSVTARTMNPLRPWGIFVGLEIHRSI